jgi:hypothetical protein
MVVYGIDYEVTGSVFHNARDAEDYIYIIVGLDEENFARLKLVEAVDLDSIDSEPTGEDLKQLFQTQHIAIAAVMQSRPITNPYSCLNIALLNELDSRMCNTDSDNTKADQADIVMGEDEDDEIEVETPSLAQRPRIYIPDSYHANKTRWLPGPDPDVTAWQNLSQDLHGIYGYPSKTRGLNCSTDLQDLLDVYYCLDSWNPEDSEILVHWLGQLESSITEEVFLNIYFINQINTTLNIYIYRLGQDSVSKLFLYRCCDSWEWY